MMTMVRPFFIAFLLMTSLGRAQTSRSGAFHADIQIQDGAAKYPGLSGWVATVSDEAGSVRYRLSKEVPYDVPYPALYLSDVDGRSVAVSSFNGTIEYVDGRGNVTRVLTPFGEGTPEYERNIKCSIAGARAAFLLSSPLWSNARVFMTNLDGDEVWTVDLEGTHAGEVFLAANGKYLVAGSYVAGVSPRFVTVLFDGRGTMVRTFDMLFRYADISAEGGQLALTDRNSILLTTTQPEAPVVRWSTDSRDRIITGVCFFDAFIALTTEQILVEDGTPYYTDPRLVVLDAHGMLRATRVLEGKSKNPVQLVRKGSEVVMSGASSSLLFSADELTR